MIELEKLTSDDESYVIRYRPLYSDDRIPTLYVRTHDLGETTLTRSTTLTEWEAYELVASHQAKFLYPEEERMMLKTMEETPCEF